MRFTEINPFGVYVAPMSSMMVVPWVATIGLRWSLPVSASRNAIGAALRLGRRRRRSTLAIA